MKPLEPWHLGLDGTHLIEASAGTGKTYTIGTLVLRLVLESGWTIDRILVVTFTRAATAELRDRIRRRLVDALAALTSRHGATRDDVAAAAASADGLTRYLAGRSAAGQAAADAAALAAALRDFDTAPIFTIHGFCQRVLQEFAFESGTSFEATLVDDPTALQREIVADYWASQTYAAPTVLVAHLLHTATVTPDALHRLATALAGARGLDVLPAADGDPAAGPEVAAHGDRSRAAKTADGIGGDGAAAPTPDAAWLEGTLGTWRAARAAARTALAAGRADIEVLLSTSAALAHRSLSKASVPRWLDQIGAWLASDAPPPAGPIAPTLARITSVGIAPHVKDGCAPPTHPVIDALDRFADAEADLAAGLTAWSERIRLGLVPYVQRETRLRRQRAHAQAFDDLLHDLAAALEGERGPRLADRARARYAAALIDEFQDTDDVQYRIFRALFGAGADPLSSATAAEASVPSRAAPATFLALIGDPKQAIYAFRGADVFAYLRAADDAGPERRWTLSRNRRSDEGLVRTLNALWSGSRVRQPFVYPGIGYHEIEPHHPDRLVGARSDAPSAPPSSLTILRLSPDDPGAEVDANGWLRRDWAQRVIPRRVAGDIARLLAAPPVLRVAPDRHDGDRPDEVRERRAGENDVAGGTRPIEPGDIAVLTRTNQQTAAVQRALGHLGIPSVRLGEASVFETDEASELARVLAGVIEPGAARLVRGALATRLLGADAARLTILATDEAAWEAEIERFRGWLERWQQAGFIQAFRRIVDEAGVAERLLSWRDGERRLTNVQHLAELLHGAAHANGHGPRALLGWLARMRTDAAARAAEVGDSAQLRLERDTKAVQVVTIHRSKGLEYPIVYCPYLWYRSQPRAAIAVRFTDPTDGRPKLDIGAPPAQAHVDAAAVDDIAEDMRLAYVAVTRAKHSCAVVWGPIVGAANSGLARLFHPASAHAAAVGASRAAADGGGPGHMDDAVNGNADSRTPTRQDLDDALAHAARRLADPAALDADLADLASRAAAIGGAITVRSLAFSAAPTPHAASPSPVQLTARRFTGRIPHSHRRTSYSALTAVRRGTPADAEATRDHDAEPDEGGGWVATESTPPDAGAVGAATPAVVTLEAFPAGADPGTCLHSVFERIDFANPALWPDVAAEACRRAGIDAAMAEGLPAALAEIVATRLGDGPTHFTLADVPRGVRLNEMPFVLPVALGPGGIPRHAFTPADLSAALAADGGHGLPPDYPDAVGGLEFDAVRGHLSGFVDMVCRVGGRWYVVDWKSNRLGSAWDDYAPDRIAAAMAHHHYYLQYHLYTVAVHRYLGRRVPGYRYADHFGGIFYLFVRGMHPALGPTRGVHFDRPPEARIARLDAVLRGEAVR